jgi:tetratricopeptide (TPR) repeat protein
VAVVLLPIVFLGQGAWFIAANSQTYDEAIHLCAGYSYLATGDFRSNPEHPPLMKELAALPVWLCYRLPIPAGLNEADGDTDAEYVVARRFLYENAPSGPSADRVLNLARVPALLLGTLLVGLVGLWSYRLWGRGGCLLGMALAAFDPNLVAHASLVTNDLGLAFFALLTLYFLWEYTGGSAPSWWQLVAIGVSLGLALASKYSAVSLLGILAVVAGAEMFCGRPLRLPARAGARGKNKTILGRFAEAGAVIGILLGLAFLVLWSTYFFRSLTACSRGLAVLLDHQHRGHMAFLMGQYSDAGWWYYFLVALLVKTPLPTLILIAASFVLCRSGSPLRWRSALFLVVPVVLVLAATTTVRINIGLRHVLLGYPFLYVAAARMATIRIGRGWLMPGLSGGLAALSALSSLWVAPYELSYFNELAGGPAGGLYYLGDSNLDWGQGLRGLKAYMERERIPMVYLSHFGSAMPEDYGIRYQFAPGCVPLWPPSQDVLPAEAGREILAVSAISLQGTYFGDRNLYRWLLDRQPVATIGHAIYIYDLTGDVDAHLALAKVYLEAGPVTLAIPELQKVLKVRPNNAEAHSGLGVALTARGEPDEAIAHFQRALEIKPDYAEAYDHLGAALAHRGEFDEAIAQCRRALEIKPDYAEAHNNLGAALVGRGRVDEAMSHYRRALEIKPDYAEAHYNLGLALAGCGRIKEAIEHYQKSLQPKPDYAEALNELAWLRATCPEATFRDGTAAIELAQRAIRLSGGKTPEMLDTLAAAYAEAGMFSQATETVGKALDLARRQNKTVLVEKLKARLCLYGVVGTPYRETQRPFSPRATGP